MRKSWKFFYNEIVSNEKVKLQCLKFEGVKETSLQIATVDSNLIAEALCQIAEVHIKDKFLIDRKVLALIANLPQDEIKLKKLVISSERPILD